MAEKKNEDLLEKRKRLFKQYIRSKRIMIVDPQAYSRTALSATLIELGAIANQIETHTRFDQAELAMSERCPDVLLAEFELDGGTSGLDLLATQRKRMKQTKDSLFILVTGNTSQAAIAQAAEEDVDGYLLKPFSVEGLRNAILRYSLEKAFPNPYIRKIEEGKKSLQTQKTEDAKKAFKEALDLDPKPSLAYFYHGITEEVQHLVSGAERDYSKGLEFNRIHYKCMIGLLELFIAQNRHKDAYEVVRKIARYFPANPDRLALVLRLAILTESYGDIEGYYQLFCKLEKRSPNLIRYISAALIVCGKYYLSKKSYPRAIELFHRAKSSSKHNTRFLRQIIVSLLDYDLDSEAGNFLSAFPAETQSTPEYAALKYAIEERKLAEGASIAKGRDLLVKGIEDPLIYAVLIRRSAAAGLMDAADQLVHLATQQWPDREDEFLKAYNATPETKAA